LCLHKIDWVHRSAELGIVIGDKDFWGKGYGKQAWAMITEYGLNTLNLHRIYAHVLSDNESSAKCAKASGFKKEGTITDMLFKNGSYKNMDYYNKVKSTKKG
jgi:RimJ/RimL family protein N-acetyltransferase